MKVLTEAWSYGFTARSNFARENAEAVGEAACRSLITLRTNRLEWGCMWRITALGLRLLEKHQHEIRVQDG